MVKILITTIPVNFVPIDQAAPNSPELLLLKFLPLTYHHSHFLAATLDFTSFFTIAFLRAALFFTAWLFLIRYTLQINVRIHICTKLLGLFNCCVSHVFQFFLVIIIVLLVIIANASNVTITEVDRA